MKFFVDLDVLKASADKIDVTAENLGKEHAIQHQMMLDAQSGWVGMSGRALVTLTEQWDLETRAHRRVLRTRAQTYRDTAHRVSDVDGDIAGQLSPWKIKDTRR